jgi:hypothetical protein
VEVNVMLAAYTTALPSSALPVAFRSVVLGGAPPVVAVLVLVAAIVAGAVAQRAVAARRERRLLRVVRRLPAGARPRHAA